MVDFVQLTNSVNKKYKDMGDGTYAEVVYMANTSGGGAPTSLNDLTDVSLNGSPANGSTLTYNTTTGKWEDITSGNTTYTVQASVEEVGAGIALLGSDNSNTKVKLIPGTGINIAASGTNNDAVSISAVPVTPDGDNGAIQIKSAGGFFGTEDLTYSGSDKSITIGKTGNNLGVKIGGTTFNSISIGNNNGGVLNPTFSGFNVFIGNSISNTADNQSSSVLIGEGAGHSLQGGSSNVFLGYAAGYNHQSGINNIVLGANANTASATVSNTVTLGDANITTLRCAATTITSLSDARDKKDIQDITNALALIRAVNPVSFTWNMREGGKVDIPDTGFVAQQLQQAQVTSGVTVPGLVDNINPERLEASYGKLIPFLVKALKDLDAEFQAYKAANTK
jgi:hypothetical protein